MKKMSLIILRMRVEKKNIKGNGDQKVFNIRGDLLLIINLN